MLAGICPAFGDDHQDPIKIGVLATRGTERCLAKWGPTAEYLTDQVTGRSFVIVPLSYPEICPTVERGDLAFVLANPAFYVELEARYGVNRLATLKNLRLGSGYTTFGGVIFCRADRDDIKGLADLKGKTFMGVERGALAGWLAAWREMKDMGIDPHRDFADLRFGGTHDAVVYAVRDGQVDVGSVRTDTLERMAREGKIALEDFRVIHEHGGPKVRLPFVHSTRSYPEWPFAELAHTSHELAEKVAVALLNMPADSPAAKAAGCVGWTVPLNYQSVHECLKELRVGPYTDYGKVTLGGVLRRYLFWILSIAALLAAMAVATVWLLRLNQAQKRLRAKLERQLSERKRAEGELRERHDFLENLIGYANAPIIVWDPASRITRFNRAFECLTGYAADEVVGRELCVLFPEPSREESLAKIARAMGGEHWETVEIPIRCKSGETRSVLWNSANVYSEGGTILLATIAQGVDVTERRALEEQLRQAQKMEAIGTLAGGIAHDFNNLLTTIMGNTELAKSLLDEDHQALAALTSIEEASQQAGGVAKALLTFSHRAPVQRAPVELARVLTEATHLLGRLLPAAVELIEDVPTEPAIWVYGDATQLQQILFNLAVNARDAMPGGGRLYVRLRAETLEESGLAPAEDRPNLPGGTLVVEDTGQGMSEEVRSRIFEPFFTTKPRGQGTGLGLSVVYGAVTDQRGMIRVDSEPGRGTRVSIWLPACDRQMVPSPPRREASRAPADGELVILAEYDRQVRSILVGALRAEGYEVTAVADGLEAVAAVNAHLDEVRLVIMDLDLPKMHGLTCLKEIRRLGVDVPVVVVTGSVGFDAAHTLGQNDLLLRKPFRTSDLIELAADALTPLTSTEER